MPKFFFLLLFLITSLPGFTQEETVQPLNPNSGKVIIRGAPAAPAPAPGAPVADPAAVLVDPAAPPLQDEDDSVSELENARLESQKKFEAIETVTKPLAEPLNPMEEIQKLGYQQVGVSALLDPKVLAIIQKNFKDGPLTKLSEAEVSTLILEKAKGSMFEDFLKNSPKVLKMCANLMRDKDALLGLLGILVRKDDLKTYMYISIGIFLFGMFVKHRIIKPKFSAFKKFRYSLTVSLILTSITFYIFYSLFGQELGPTLSVISKSF